MTIKQQIIHTIEKAINDTGLQNIPIHVDYPADPKHGDYSTNVALIAFQKYKESSIKDNVFKNPLEIAQEIVEILKTTYSIHTTFSLVEAVPPGFINFTLKDDILIDSLTPLKISSSPSLSGKKLFIEYAHPNTHKEMHIGHMRTLITGEALARLAEAVGAKVFRANYQGDIGLHVAKALYGIQVLMQEQQLTVETISPWSHADKAHFLGQGYALGSREYEAQKKTIDQINKDLYAKDSEIYQLYSITRQWSLDYYEEFYKRFYTKFDTLFFESDVADSGKKIVEKNVGKIFHKENGAIVFPGEQYGLHTRVFITTAGNPTYEGKEMGNAFAEYNVFPFDMKIHVVGSEQNGYFAVVFKALELLDSEKFKAKQRHVSMGMVQLADRKMSSRTGDVLRVDDLIDEVKTHVGEIMTVDRIGTEHRDDIIEQIAIGAIKYSVLQVGTGQNVAFDIKRSIALDGNSGPYLQYAYARTQSVLGRNGKWQMANGKWQIEKEERDVLRSLVRFPEIVEEAAVRYAPHLVATYLFELAQAFNTFYQKMPILKAEDTVRDFRLHLTKQTGETLKRGLHLLGIKAPERM